MKQRRAAELLEELIHSASPTLIPWQVVGELLSCLRRWQSMGIVSADDLAANIADIMSMFPLALPTATVIARSLSLGSRYSLSHWDSMLVAACLDAGIETLYTEDMDHGATYDSVKVVNPFR